MAATRRSNCTCVCAVATIISSTSATNSRTGVSGVATVTHSVSPRGEPWQTRTTQPVDLHHNVFRERAEECHGRGAVVRAHPLLSVRRIVPRAVGQLEHRTVGVATDERGSTVVAAYELERLFHERPQMRSPA